MWKIGFCEINFQWGIFQRKLTCSPQSISIIIDSAMRPIISLLDCWIEGRQSISLVHGERELFTDTLIQLLAVFLNEASMVFRDGVNVGRRRGRPISRETQRQRKAVG